MKRAQKGANMARPEAIVVVHESERFTWKHIMVIVDGGLTLFELERALLAGWNVRKVTIQSGEDWCGWKATSIATFKLEGGARLATEHEREWALARPERQNGGEPCEKT